MRRLWSIVLLLWLWMGFPGALWAQTENLSVAERNAQQGFNDTIDRLAPDFVTVSLVVAEPYEVLYSTLGHAALHLQCPIFNLDYIFTYESENVREKIWTFLKGNLRMGMYALPPEIFLDSYRETGRGVKEYTLNLSPVQKQKLWEVMDRHVEEGINLPYDYFHRGCAKSVVRVMHEAIGTRAIHYAPWSKKYTEQTMRELCCDFVTDAPWVEWVSYFLVGTAGDRDYPCEQKLIVPTDLVEVWQQATFDNGEPVLDSKPRVLLESTKHNQSTWCTPLLISIVLLALALLSMASLWTKNKRLRVAGAVVDYSILAIASVIGAVMTYLIIFSGLPCTDWNWLIIPFNIIPIIFWHWRRYWAPWYAGLLFLWCIVMIGEFFFGHVLVDWPHILLVFAFAVVLLKQKFLSSTVEAS